MDSVPSVEMQEQKQPRSKRSKKRSKASENEKGSLAEKALKNITGGTVKPNVEKLNIWKASHPIAA